MWPRPELGLGAVCRVESESCEFGRREGARPEAATPPLREVSAGAGADPRSPRMMRLACPASARGDPHPCLRTRPVASRPLEPLPGPTVALGGFRRHRTSQKPSGSRKHCCFLASAGRIAASAADAEARCARPAGSGSTVSTTAGPRPSSSTAARAPALRTGAALRGDSEAGPRGAGSSSPARRKGVDVVPQARRHTIWRREGDRGGGAASTHSPGLG
eukprot:scaffold870_cov393-Prasinococcus_capsulatus_cf.AAC.6